jgi:hypothetical protein
LFGELPKLFGREFAIGFFLPMVAFLLLSLATVSGFENISDNVSLWVRLIEGDKQLLVGATIFVFIVWLGAVTLSALNRDIIRLKEGYGKINPALILLRFQRWRLRRVRRQLEELDREYIAMDVIHLSLDPRSARRRERLSRVLAEEFPHDEAFLLPTAFGNTLRAFEVYSAVMYGLDAIPAWPRLIMVMSKDSLALIETAKSQMDFWLNLWFLSLVLLLEYVLMVLSMQEVGSLWVLLAIPAALVASNRARAAAQGWGETVKAAFDVYIPELRKRVELPYLQDRLSDWKQWQDLSVAMIYRDREALPPKNSKDGAKKAGEGGTDGGSPPID